jgi:hypothetical protein
METSVLSLGLDVRENSKDKEEVGMRCTALFSLFSLNLNRWHKDKGGEDSSRHPRWAQTPRHTCNKEVEDVAVQSPR